MTTVREITLVREDVWRMSDAGDPWPPALLAYARAVQAMQAKPITDPTSWEYQAAVHGRPNTDTDRLPWNTCQHSTWYFLPWHRMYLFQFERIIRSHVIADGGPEDWALPYWDYSSRPEHRYLPLAFRERTLPDGTPNPLWVEQRRPALNSGAAPLTPPAVTDISEAMSLDFFTSQGIRTGFGGPGTVAVHFGSEAGGLEARPHNVIHVAIGGPGGWMSNPDLAALDPIFWLHHANIDRLWEAWLSNGNINEEAQRFTGQSFQLFDPDLDELVCMSVGDVLNTLELGYTYEDLPSVATVGRTERSRRRVPRKPNTAMVGRADSELTVAPEGGQSVVSLGQLPQESAAASDGAGPRFHIQLAEITGEQNPGVVYGVYLDLPEGATPEELTAHRVGLVSFFGIEHTLGRSSHPLQYTFDITEALSRLRSDADPTEVRVTLLPLEGQEPEESAAAAEVPTVRVGTVAVLASDV